MAKVWLVWQHVSYEDTLLGVFATYEAALAHCTKVEQAAARKDRHSTLECSIREERVRGAQ